MKTTRFEQMFNYGIHIDADYDDQYGTEQWHITHFFICIYIHIIMFCGVTALHKSEINT